MLEEYLKSDARAGPEQARGEATTTTDGHSRSHGAAESSVGQQVAQTAKALNALAETAFAGLGLDAAAEEERPGPFLSLTETLKETWQGRVRSHS